VAGLRFERSQPGATAKCEFSIGEFCLEADYATESCLGESSTKTRAAPLCPTVGLSRQAEPTSPRSDLRPVLAALVRGRGSREEGSQSAALLVGRRDAVGRERIEMGKLTGWVPFVFSDR